MSVRNGVDLSSIKSAAKNRWADILHRTCGVNSDFLSGRHGPCPKCGGKDRWHVFKDFDETGGGVCNQCGRFADGLSVIQWLTGCDFPTAIERTAVELGMKVQARKDKPDPKKNLEFHPWSVDVANFWCLKKKPISQFAVRLVGAMMAKYRGQYPVIALPVYGQNAEVVGQCLYHATGKTLPVWSGSDQPEQKKIKLTAGSSAGWIGPTTEEVQSNAEVVWKTEGPSDLLALLSLDLPQDHSACCNAFGAGEDPSKNPWMLDRFKGKIVYVIHDCDAPGQDGAIAVRNGDKTRPGWAPAIANVAVEVRNVVLPYPIEPTHGKDLRDWISEQMAAGLNKEEIYAKLLDMAKLSQIIQAKPIDEPKKVPIEHDDDPYRLARKNLEKYDSKHGGRLVFWKSEWWKYKDGRYQQISDSELKAKVTHSIRVEFDFCWEREMAEYEEWRASDDYSKAADKGPPRVQRVTRALVNNVIGAMESICCIPSSVQMPCWLPTREKRNYLSMRNGVLDLTKLFDGADEEDCLLPHSPDWFSACRLDYAFDSDAQCPKWLQYLDYTMEGDRDRIAILQEWAGYLLTSDNNLQRFLVLEGEGKNGKTVYFAAMTAMLGEMNVSHVSIEQFGERFSLSSTVGKSANISGDAGDIDSVAEGVLKQFTGGDSMEFDRKNKDPLVTRPTAKLMCAWNTRPHIKDRSDGIWRRMLIVPFKRFIPKEKRVLGMDSPQWWIDSNETCGILKWALMGLHRLKVQEEFSSSEKCNEEISEYRKESNPAIEFITELVESTEQIDTEYVPCNVVYSAYVNWCKETGHKPFSDTKFGKEIRRVFPYVVRSRKRDATGNNWVYFGLKLRETKQNENDGCSHESSY